MNKIISIIALGLGLATTALAQNGERTAPAAAPKNGSHAPAPQDLPTGIDAGKVTAEQHADGAKSANSRRKAVPQELPNPAEAKDGQKKSTVKTAVQELPNG
ncbi:MAG: hypothetical protein RI894_906 [Bacteroidota bacterium]|jgi:hypothetical protein